MNALYLSLENIINKIDFDAIWKGFCPYNFALYDDGYVYFKNEKIPRDNRFLGNTAIEYNGEMIAIWNVTNPFKEDAQDLAASLVHEMFHAYQKSLGESRFPNDLLLLDYPDDLENYQIKHAENRLLAKAYYAKERGKKIETLNAFMSCRKYRQAVKGDILKQEYLTETIEGMAEYAGLSALKQISQEKYINKVEEYARVLASGDQGFFDIRRMSYFSGALFCLLLRETGIDFYHQIGENNLTVFEIVSQEVKPKKPLIEKDSMVKPFEDYSQRKKEKFEDFFKQKREERTGDFTICGYDPMNMIKSGNMVLCSHFIMLRKEQGGEPLFIKGPLLVKLKENSHSEVYSYLK